jgi:hypothetical protein
MGIPRSKPIPRQPSMRPHRDATQGHVYATRRAHRSQGSDSAARSPTMVICRVEPG